MVGTSRFVCGMPLPMRWSLIETHSRIINIEPRYEELGSFKQVGSTRDLCCSVAGGVSREELPVLSQIGSRAQSV